MDEANDTFFLILNSNDSINFHPKNNQSMFTVQFDRNFEFLRKMEIGLMEITFPTTYTYNNFPETNVFLIIEGFKKNVLGKIKIMEKSVSSEKEFFNYLSTSLAEFNENTIKKWLKKQFLDISNVYEDILYKRIDIPEINLINNKVIITKGVFSIMLQDKIDKKWATISLTAYYTFEDNINKLISQPESYYFSSKIISTNEINIDFLYNFIVCVDIAKPSIYGNSKENILRIISKNEFDKRSKTFNPILFSPLNKNVFDSITVSIKDDYNHIINFKNGTTRLVLLFRPLEHI